MDTRHPSCCLLGTSMPTASGCSQQADAKGTGEEPEAQTGQ